MAGESTIMRRIPDRVVIAVATLGPLGYLGRGPGTNGSFAGVAAYALLLYPLPHVLQLLLAAVLVALGYFFCGEAEVRMQKRDPGEIILDEFVSIPIVFLGIDSELSWLRLGIVLLAGFILFRIFDIAKPLGIHRLQALPGGWGVLLDDVAAALAACLVLNIMIYAAKVNAWYF